MSNAYDRFGNQRGGRTAKPLNTRPKISFEDSDQSERSEAPNIFVDQRQKTSKVKGLLRRNRPRNDDTLQEINLDSRAENLRSFGEESKMEPVFKQSIQLIDDEDVPQGQQELEPNSELKLGEIFNLYAGDHTFKNNYPLEKVIYIDNNNAEENQMNRKDRLVKFKTAKSSAAYYSNQLAVSPFILLALLLKESFMGLYLLLWLIVMILRYVVEPLYFSSSMQYTCDKSILLAMLISSMMLTLLSSWMSASKRRHFLENQEQYKIYHHDGHTAEWILVKATEIKSGQICKISPGKSAPVDCLLLHSDSSMVPIREEHLFSRLMQKNSAITLKETLMKSQVVILPISGRANYSIQSADINQFQINGSLSLQEPVQIIHNFTHTNILFRGTINASQNQILCLVLETGIDSLTLKEIQYPRQLSSSFDSEQEKDKEHAMLTGGDSLLKVDLKSKLEQIILLSLLAYLILLVTGILYGFICTQVGSTPFYVGSALPIWAIVLYYIFNSIVIVPIFMHCIFNLFIWLNGRLTESQISTRLLDFSNEKNNRVEVDKKNELVSHERSYAVEIKDYNVLPRLTEIDTIITTLDTFRNEAAYTLHSVKVKQISHNFMTGSFDNEIYAIEDLELIKYFMSVALLTTINDKNAACEGYQKGIEHACKSALSLDKSVNIEGEVVVSGGEFRVKHLFSIDSLHNNPYKISFLQTGSVDSQKVLVLVRGNTKTILDKVYGKQVKMAEESRKLYEEKGYHVEMVGKTILMMKDVEEIEKAYKSTSMHQNIFYKNLERYISKVEAMGLLIFVNQFHQPRFGHFLKNPILNKSVLNTGFESTNAESTTLSSSSLPKMIIVAPPSRSSQPEFESIHTITNLLINPYVFNFSLPEVADKILHDAIPADHLIEKLLEEKVLVWNGWDAATISEMMGRLKQLSRKIAVYLERDEYLFLMKQGHIAVYGGDNGHDCSKYSDINLTSSSSASFIYLAQLLGYDAIVTRQGLLSLLLTQLSKIVMVAVIEIIHVFYTWGTGLAIFRSPLHLLLEVVLLFDVLFYLNWKDSVRAVGLAVKDSFVKKALLEGVLAGLVAFVTTFIVFYSLENPPDSTGTPHSNVFTQTILVYTILHILVLQKLVTNFSCSVSLYRLTIVIMQISMIYIGLLIISITSFEFQGIIWSLLQGKMLLTAVCCTWMALCIYSLRWLLPLLRLKQLKKDNAKQKLLKD